MPDINNTTLELSATDEKDPLALFIEGLTKSFEQGSIKKLLEEKDNKKKLIYFIKTELECPLILARLLAQVIIYFSQYLDRGVNAACRYLKNKTSSWLYGLLTKQIAKYPDLSHKVTTFFDKLQSGKANPKVLPDTTEEDEWAELTAFVGQNFTDVKKELENINGVLKFIRTDTPLPLEFNLRELNPLDPDDPYDWLLARCEGGIQFVGRKAELHKLRDFVDQEAPFKWWQLVAPAGAGKTRLVIQWLKDYPKNEWDCGFLSSTSHSYWEKWRPVRPTIIVVDYLYSYTKAVETIFDKCVNHSNSFAYPVRLLIIDHNEVNLSRLSETTFWNDIFASNDGIAKSAKRLHHSETPLSLTENPEDQTYILRSIIEQRFKGTTCLSCIEEGLSQLKKINAYHPLFAALAGDCLRKGHAPTSWSRRGLIEFCLRGTRRQPWRNKEHAKTGYAAGVLVCCATARQDGKVDLDILPDFMEDHELMEAEALAHKIVSSSLRERLPKLEPDLLGETFFMRFMSSISKTEWKNSLKDGIWIKNKPSYPNIIEFVKRTVNNIIIDIKNTQNKNSDIKILWNGWVNFLSHSKPSTNNTDISSIAWFDAITNTCIILIENELNEEAKDLIKLVTHKYIFNISKKISRPVCVISLLRFIQIRKMLNHQAKDCTYDDTIKNIISEINKRKEQYITPALHMAANNNFHLVISDLVKFGCTINETGKNKETALHHSCLKGHTKSTEELIKSGADVNVKDYRGTTPLYIAIAHDYNNIVKILIQANADLDIKDNEGDTPLNIAISRDNTETALEIINTNANINAQENKGFAALHFAVHTKNIEIISALIKKQANLDVQDFQNATPLHYAAYTGDLQTVNLLIENGASTNIIDLDGERPIDTARKQGNQNIVDYLKQFE